MTLNNHVDLCYNIQLFHRLSDQAPTEYTSRSIFLQDLNFFTPNLHEQLSVCWPPVVPGHQMSMVDITSFMP